MHLDTLPPLSPLVVLSLSFEWYPSSLWPPILERRRFSRFLCQDKKLQKWAYHICWGFCWTTSWPVWSFLPARWLERFRWECREGVPRYDSGHLWMEVACWSERSQEVGESKPAYLSMVDRWWRIAPSQTRGVRLVLEIRWIAFSGDLRGDFWISSLQSGHCSLGTLQCRWSWLVVGCSAYGISDAAFIRSGWRRVQIWLPGSTLLLTHPGDWWAYDLKGMDSDNWDWSSPELSGCGFLVTCQCWLGGGECCKWFGGRIVRRGHSGLKTCLGSSHVDWYLEEGFLG